MAYADAQAPANRAATFAAVAGIHVGIGALLVLGLAVTSYVVEKKPPLTGEQINIEPPPPPPEKATPEPVNSAPSEAAASEVFTPDPPISLSNTPPDISGVEIIPLPLGPVQIPGPPAGSGNGTQGAAPTPSPAPSFDPVAARPANNASRWVTDADYRSSWVARGYEGDVGFRLSIDAGGNVTDCSITRSSGIRALDNATCSLVSRRARFDPAKDTQGKAVRGQYRNSVRWQLPE